MGIFTNPLNQLLDGNKRWVKGKPSHPHCDRKRLREVAAHQKPFALVLSCMDSRVTPEFIFDVGVGDIVVQRTAGQVIDPIVIEGIEYAIAHLGVRLVVVLGHESCGAMTAAVRFVNAGGNSNELPYLMNELTPAVEAAKYSKDKELSAATKANVALVVKRIRQELPRLIKDKKVEVVGAVYDIHTLGVKLVNTNIIDTN